MAKISFKKNTQFIIVPLGTNLMSALLKADLPVASSCHGDGVCAKCVIEIHEGSENLSPIHKREESLLKKIPNNKSIRFSCQTKVMGDILVDTTYW